MPGRRKDLYCEADEGEEEGEGSDIVNVPAVVSISAGALILITNGHSRTNLSCPPFRFCSKLSGDKYVLSDEGPLL